VGALMNIPSQKQCFHLIIDMDMMDHIVAHSFHVSRTATFLVDVLADQGIALDRNLVKVSAMLHDITKTRSLMTHEDHALTGALLLEDLGYPEVGNIIRQHVRLDKYCTSQTPVEAEVVNYADKRVLHDQVVTLQERKSYILKRYGNEANKQIYINELFDSTIMLEEKLFGYLPISPDRIKYHVQSKDLLDDFLVYRHSERNYSSSAIERKHIVVKGK
jgi:uncharacterized protein